MDAEPAFFEAVIVPHRSLSANGLRLLIGAICTLSVCTTAVFWWLGAWPIAGFNGVEITTALLLLRHNARAVRSNEVILLSDSALRIIRTDRDGRRTEQTVPPAWLRMHWQERPGRVSGLYLMAHGTQIEIAASLGEPEKLDLANALETALHRWRNPRFDNPQLA
ncbi:DUF2244 domain-containing protein [Acidisphaera sp. L21]|uniref:DUF2244 domain-containing protein n=1 Tax=Acidisphaera sp. L21 TaxID=1641851 RepID=UPI00131CCE66|nr:DUF2244 domain-containing protein [Acidisphaera sp. L21]